MGSKVRCPSCGAKNDNASRRCRLCTAVINADIPEAAPEQLAATDSPLSGHFDAGEIERQIQPARSRFGSGPSGLGARLAAANGGERPDRHSPTSAPDEPPGVPAEPNVEQTGWAPAANPDEERFDPDALFRDMS